MESNRSIQAQDIIARVRKNDPNLDALILCYLQAVFQEQGISFLDATVKQDVKVALNSVHGQCTTTEGETLFFKFHTEEGEVSALGLQEIYQGALLGEAGWNVLKPRAASMQPGRQCVLYPIIESPTAYQTLLDLDLEFIRTGTYTESKKSLFLEALRESLRRQSSLLIRSLVTADAEVSNASIHQLFSHRLIGKNGEAPRVEKFYGTSSELFKKRWIVNGRSLPYSIEDLIQEAMILLAADRSIGMASVIAHGDDHFGNQFCVENEVLFFDPAFAGRMPALLAPVKATAHNTIAHPLWLYEPSLMDSIEFTYQESKDFVLLQHNWGAQRSPIRLEILVLYIEEIWTPLLQKLRDNEALPKDWKRYVHAAIFCSPFLAKNLSDRQEYPKGLHIVNFGLLLESCLLIEEYMDAIAL